MLIGFLIAMPIGPIDMLCIQRTVISGARFGFITGMGAAFADGIYGASAAFGLISLRTFLLSYQLFFQSIGGLFLCCIGLRNFQKKQINELKQPPGKKLSLGFFTTFFLALMSPMTILSFVGAFAVFGVRSEGTSLETALMLTFGVFIGSSSWWLLLNNGVAILKNKFNLRYLHWINKMVGASLFSFGVIAISLALKEIFLD